MLNILVFVKIFLSLGMTLFDNISLFDEGKKQYKDFCLPDAALRLWQQFFSKADSDRYFQLLLAETQWSQRMRKMYDRVVPDPRLTAYFGGANGFEWTE